MEDAFRLGFRAGIPYNGSMAFAEQVGWHKIGHKSKASEEFGTHAVVSSLEPGIPSSLTLFLASTLLNRGHGPIPRLTPLTYRDESTR